MRQKLLQIVAESAPSHIVSDETQLATLALDSLELIEIVRRVGEKFNCEIPNGDLDRIQTVADFYRYLPA